MSTVLEGLDVYSFWHNIPVTIVVSRTLHTQFHQNLTIKCIHATIFSYITDREYCDYTKTHYHQTKWLTRQDIMV